MTIAIKLNHGYSISAVKQMTVGFGDLLISRRTYRPLIGGFFTSALCLSASFMGGLWWEYLRVRWFLETQFAKPTSTVRPPHLAMGGGLDNSFLGGHKMAQTSVPVRSEQTQSPIFNLAARAARKAARQWFVGIPTQSLAEWRDTCRLAHCDGLPNPKERSSAFDTAFACEIGHLIIGGGRGHD